MFSDLDEFLDSLEKMREPVAWVVLCPAEATGGAPVARYAWVNSGGPDEYEAREFVSERERVIAAARTIALHSYVIEVSMSAQSEAIRFRVSPGEEPRERITQIIKLVPKPPSRKLGFAVPKGAEVVIQPSFDPKAAIEVNFRTTHQHDKKEMNFTQRSMVVTVRRQQ